ncbi:protein ORF97 [Anguillid herpesvirus 1]|uniref:Protein ORF97 n=1 Tax=Anguillid herpesvirus 1 TaxID=150286 RepID=A0A1J0REI8_9VIRU|nr:protein ORF97 [Anguillid herpesvirus 1]ADA57860.1 protein ORF97 [Anguillid herpesvirus 1]APD76261.1 ORF97 [Anguillid herpesvirus 1]QRM16392.1 protein ORF97 [Anguillid herpesvirus 1]QRM16520.1 protein ORF97 [Anguillid herpesvirus 1]QRM16651.1 protein ORF97 [Anguillid herpesvirus 1]
MDHIGSKLMAALNAVSSNKKVAQQVFCGIRLNAINSTVFSPQTALHMSCCGLLAQTTGLDRNTWPRSVLEQLLEDRLDKPTDDEPADNVNRQGTVTVMCCACGTFMSAPHVMWSDPGFASFAMVSACDKAVPHPLIEPVVQSMAQACCALGLSLGGRVSIIKPDDDDNKVIELNVRDVGPTQFPHLMTSAQKRYDSMIGLLIKLGKSKVQKLAQAGLYHHNERLCCVWCETEFEQDTWDRDSATLTEMDVLYSELGARGVTVNGEDHVCCDPRQATDVRGCGPVALVSDSTLERLRNVPVRDIIFQNRKLASVLCYDWRALYEPKNKGGLSGATLLYTGFSDMCLCLSCGGIWAGISIQLHRCNHVELKSMFAKVNAAALGFTFIARPDIDPSENRLVLPVNAARTTTKRAYGGRATSKMVLMAINEMWVPEQMQGEQNWGPQLIDAATITEFNNAVADWMAEEEKKRQEAQARETQDIADSLSNLTI